MGSIRDIKQNLGSVSPFDPGFSNFGKVKSFVGLFRFILFHIGLVTFRFHFPKIRKVFMSMIVELVAISMTPNTFIPDFGHTIFLQIVSDNFRKHFRKILSREIS